MTFVKRDYTMKIYWLLWLSTAVIYAVYFQDKFAMYLSSKFGKTEKLSDCLLDLKNISQKSLWKEYVPAS